MHDASWKIGSCDIENRNFRTYTTVSTGPQKLIGSSSALLSVADYPQH